jgi:hypothetical protein
MRVSDLFSAIADRGKLYGCSSPVIVTDIITADCIVRALEADLGMRGGELRAPNCIGMYDGVVITHPGWPLPAGWQRKTAASEWRDHFGDLTEIYG